MNGASAMKVARSAMWSASSAWRFSSILDTSASSRASRLASFTGVPFVLVNRSVES